MEGNLSILLVEDHELVRSGLVRLLSDQDFPSEIVEAESGELAIELCQSYQPDVVLMDLTLPGITGEETSRRIIEKQPDVAIIVLTGNLPDQSAQALLQLGIRGYLTKGCTAKEMYKAIVTVVSGEQYLSAEVARQMVLAEKNTNAISPFEQLSGRESEVVQEILAGKRNREIGEQLFISEKTVSTHRGKAFRKLGVSSAIELARLASVHGVWSGESADS